MYRLVECVPNFSEGQNNDTIKAIASAIASVKQVKLLDVDPGFHANRTVYTFAGPPEYVTEAAFNAIEIASKSIDMSIHKGAHPRIGACDVCPLIPIAGIEMDEVVKYAHHLSKRVANELKIPVFLYENAATSPERKNLEALRKGEYEMLAQKLQSGFTPDYGAPVFNSKSGIAIIGARPFLIAYNINLDTTDVSIAKKIAAEIRESGQNGVPGTLPNVKAIGWYIKEFNKVQVSMNLTDFHTTPIYQVFEEVKKRAAVYDVSVTGSELVGMIPLKAITDCGVYFLQKNNLHHHVPLSDLVGYAVNFLGLDEIKPFDPHKKILEWAMNETQSQQWL